MTIQRKEIFDICMLFMTSIIYFFVAVYMVGIAITMETIKRMIIVDTYWIYEIVLMYIMSIANFCMFTNNIIKLIEKVIKKSVV